MLERGLENESFASFLRMIWSVAGQETRWRRQHGREKSTASPNLRVGLQQFSRVGLVREQYFAKDWNRMLGRIFGRLLAHTRIAVGISENALDDVRCYLVSHPYIISQF
jgi:hypothetical protein